MRTNEDKDVGRRTQLLNRFLSRIKVIALFFCIQTHGTFTENSLVLNVRVELNRSESENSFDPM